MHQTKHDVEIANFGKGPIAMRQSFVIPAGTRVKPCNDGTGAFFVDDLSVVPEFSRHDATYYGIRIAADDVVDPSIDPTTDLPTP